MWKWLKGSPKSTSEEWTREMDRLKNNIRPSCLHLNSLIRDEDQFGKAYCPECDALVDVSLWLNNLADKVRRAASL